MVASSSSNRCCYHAFLSFRGEDTRKGFSDHLYRALELAGIHTFRDDEEIEPGADIAAELHRAIQESHVSIIVFSKDYGSSRWCLEEVAKIIERQKTDGHMVLPVFYKVDPSDVRNQSGSLAQAFAKHEKLFEEAMVTKWRKALRDVADLGGMVLGDQFESQLIQNIVEEIGKILNPRTLSVAPYAVGIDDRVEGLNQWLRDGSDDVGVAGIYGMGGIGKTTIAKAAYNMNLDSFQGSSFLADIRATSEQPNGLARLQMKLISDIKKQKPKKIYSADEGISHIKDVVRSKKVLLVLDDLDDSDQFNAFIGMQEWFHPGSKIIITTRHGHMLKANGVSKMFVAEELDERESLELFSWHAFRQSHPIQRYMELSTLIVKHCQGLPLALQVLGSSLFGESLGVWRSALDKLDVIPDGKIQKVLRISFDSLQDDHDKNLFLHISFFFIGKEKDFTISILDNLDFFTRIGIQNLVNRCLLQIKWNKLVMHQLLVDMGKGIIHEESPENPGKRSRLEYKDASITLKNLTGTKSVIGLRLNLPLLLEGTSSKAIPRSVKKRCHEESGGNYFRRRRLSFFSWKAVYVSSTRLTPSNEADFTTEAFSRMQNIKILLLNNVKLSGGYENLPKRLTWLCWQGFSLKSIPTNFYLGNLIVLELQDSSLQYMWKETKFLPCLKILDVSHSHGLLRTPDLSGVPNLERLILKDCISIVEIDETIGDLEKLVILDLQDCKNLMHFPQRIMLLRSLQELILSGCSKLIFHGNTAESSRLHPTDNDTKKLGLLSNKSWKSIWSRLSPRNTLILTSFTLASLPHSLQRLNLSRCNLSDISSDLSILSSLKYLNLSGNPILSLPVNMKSLTTLENLTIMDCTKLKTLPELPSGLRSLAAWNCSSLKYAEELPYMRRLLRPTFYSCQELVEVKGLFNIKPLRSVDIEMIKDMCLYDFGSIGDAQIEMANCLTHTTSTGPIQGLYECGIFSIFLLGSTIPDWYTYKSKGKLLMSITVPTKELKIRGLNLCVVYTKYPDRNCIKMYFSINLKVSNETKGLMWAYRPVTIGSPEKNVDMLWLSHWPFGTDDLQGGEELCISVDQGYDNLMKEFGVQLVYEHENRGNASEAVQSKREDVAVHQGVPYWSQDHVVGDLSVSTSKYEMWRGKYFLCNLRFDAYNDQFKWSQRNPALLDFSYEPDGPYNFLCEHQAEEDCEEI